MKRIFLKIRFFFFSQPSNTSVKEMTEDELIKEIQMGSQARYV